MILSIIIRLLLTFCLSFVYGYERQKAHKPVGFSTYIFVAVGACALALIATSIQPENTLPLLAATVTGIGFLGAGALIRTEDRIFGFTSAASIWLFAIIGLVIGVGEYFIGLFVYLLIWIVITYDKYLERHGLGSYQTKLTIRTTKIVHEKEINNILALNTKKFKIIGTEVDKKNDKLVLTYIIEGRKETLNKIPKHLIDKEWFESYRTH